jgi:hypothetical protein
MRKFVLIFTLLLLTACEQAVVHGPVGGAQVTVMELRSGQVIVSGGLTDDLASAQQRWDEFSDFNALVQLGLLGIVELQESQLMPTTWYLVTVQGGFDYDMDGDLVVDVNPSAVAGPVRALMTGAQLNEGGFVVGSLSEAAWQWLREHYLVMNDAELAAALDQLAGNLVLDIRDPDSDLVEYVDLLTFNPAFHSTSYFKGSLPALEAMADAIAAGADDSERLAIARDMISLEVPVGASDAWFRETISPDISQARCIACHVEGGLAEATNHLLVNESNTDHLELNGEMYAALVELLGVEAILNKAQGLNHQGGVQLSAGSADFLAFQTYLNLLDGNNKEAESLGDLFEGYSLSSAEQTLRRAALILSGRLPSASELASVAGGDEASLRFAIRLLMQGEGFHQFLIESANDRLLTDKWIEDIPFEFFFQPYFPDLTNYAAQVSEGEDINETYKLLQGIGFGMARQPLELIAHVVEAELPYTEILTADYTMVNPQLALAYRSEVSFASDEDIDQWQLASIEGFTRIDESTVYEEADDFGAYVSGGLATDYPQAGVLNTPGWLARYPSTDTNRNRARSRWTWYHFLGFDIERSALRTTDPAALSDTDNPTLKNPNCIVCHEIMDPVAGSYQNYGDAGFYKDQFGGQDSLPILYKRDRDAEDSYQFGDTWYRDMREPGFDGQSFFNTDKTLQSLAATITEDYRFALGAVKFWWPGLMGEEAARAPGDDNDADYAERLALFQSQSTAIDELAAGFIQGFNGGAPYNLKDLLVEMSVSPWFRLDRGDGDNDALLDVGTGKLLTPEQLDRKTEAVTGFRWYEQENFGVEHSQLTAAYRLFYGGIDSDGVTARATEMTALMSTVVEAQPLQMACVLVAIEFNTPQAARLLFSGVNKSQHAGNAEAALRAQFQHLHERMLGASLGLNDPEIDRVLQLFAETRQDRIAEGYPARLNGNNSESCPFQFINTGGLDLDDPDHTMNTWISVLIYYMTDYRYLYE